MARRWRDAREHPSTHKSGEDCKNLLRLQLRGESWRRGDERPDLDSIEEGIKDEAAPCKLEGYLLCKEVVRV